MNIIFTKRTEFGAYQCPQTWPDDLSIPSGFVAMSDELDLTEFFEVFGFVQLDIVDAVVVGYTVNKEVFEKYMEEHPPQPEPEPSPPTPTAEELAAENDRLKAQVEALSEQQTFLEDCLTEMAGVIYA